MYINDLCQVSEFCLPLLFADDTNLFITGNDTAEMCAKLNDDLKRISEWLCCNKLSLNVSKTHYWCAILIAHQIVMAKHGGSCVHFSGISTCGRTSRETVSHPQCPPLLTLCKISLPIYVIVTNKLLEPLTTTWYDSLVLSFSFLKI